MILLFKSYIFLREATRGCVGLKEKILGIFFVSLPEILIILIALFCELEAEEKIVSKFLLFF